MVAVDSLWRRSWAENWRNFMALGFIRDWPRPFMIIEFVGDGWWDSLLILQHQQCGYLAFSQLDLTVVVVFGISFLGSFRSTLEIFQISFGCDFQICFWCVIFYFILGVILIFSGTFLGTQLNTKIDFKSIFNNSTKHQKRKCFYQKNISQQNKRRVNSPISINLSFWDNW